MNVSKKFLIVRSHETTAFVPQVTAPPAAPDAFNGVKRFDAEFPVAISSAAKGKKSFTAVKDADGVVTDYKDVTIEGYLSTFADEHNTDRQGEYVMPGAFVETIKSFMARSPVLLRDHANKCDALVGRFTSMKEDGKGLHVVAKLSDAPDVQSIRFKVAEGILTTLSIGGAWQYASDGKGITKATLFEGSLTPVPANSDAIIRTRSLTETERKFLESGRGSYAEFVRDADGDTE